MWFTFTRSALDLTRFRKVLVEPSLALDRIFAFPSGPALPRGTWSGEVHLLLPPTKGQLSNFVTGSPTMRCHSRRNGLVGRDWGVQVEAGQLQLLPPTNALRQLQRRHSMELSRG